MKVVTAAVALDRLGPASQGSTELRIAQAPQGGVLTGPAVPARGRDSALDWGALWTLLSQLRARGVTTLADGVVVDRTLFQPAAWNLACRPSTRPPSSTTTSSPMRWTSTSTCCRPAAQRWAEPAGQLLARAARVRFDTRAITLIDAP
jgi:D-alanyl-D-alanine carboxypeptidase